jgi:peptidoglycan/xylan/chitin deacetylase (PgdA/CDA1 family)
MKYLIALVLALASTLASAQQWVPILAYHRIIEGREPGMTVITPARFTEHLRMIKAEGYTTIRIDELLSFMRGQIVLPPKTVVLTFDDGWKDQLFAAKVMNELGMSGTFYVTSGHFTDPLYMTEADVAELAKNRQFEIGAHSHTHFPELEGKDPRGMDLRMMVGEMIMSKAMLSRVIGREVQNYAWPFGYATNDSVQYAERLGFTSTAMINSSSRNVPGRTMELQRLNTDGRCTADQLKLMLSTGDLGDCK